MNEQNEDNGQFKMRLDNLSEAIEDQVIPAEINELKLEKISQRVTLISILIPVLIVIVLVIAYLDIKKRVVQTEDTGTIEFKKLSSDLESRFSSLSVRQARIEDAMERLVEQTNHTIAAIQVRLEKVDDSIKKANKEAVGQKEYNSTKEELVKQINTVVESTNVAGEQMAAIAQQLKKQMDDLSQSLSQADAQIAELGDKFTTLREQKIDKPTLDLALRLEALKIENELKTQIEALQSRIKTLESHAPSSPTKSVPSSPLPSSKSSKANSPDSSAKTPSQPAKSGTNASPGIEEQNIAK